MKSGNSAKYFALGPQDWTNTWQESGLTVAIQGKSLRDSRGRLILRNNPLEFTRFRDVNTQLRLVPYFGPIEYGNLRSRGVSRFNSYSISGPEMNRLSQEVVNSIFLDIQSTQVNLVDMFRTRLESLDMMASRINQFGRAFLALKNGRFTKFKKILGLSKSLKKPGAHKFDDIPALWLEYSYGWSPLLSDIATLADLSINVPPFLFKKKKSITLVKPRPWSNNDWSLTQDSSCRLSSSCAIEVQYDFGVLHAASQFGLTNPSITAWESVPFSFVVDWFVPIGDWLEQYGGPKTFTIRSCWSTDTIVESGSFTLVPKPAVLARYRGVSPSASTMFVQVQKKRYVRTNPGYKLYVDNPITSVSRVANALSLLAVMFKR